MIMGQGGSALGRFIQADSIVPSTGDPQAWDRYAAMNNNPVKFVDPSGHCALLEENANGLCVRNDSNIQIVRGGSAFRNPTEKALANYILSGNENHLRNVPQNSSPGDINRALANVSLELGFKANDNQWIDLFSDPYVTIGFMAMLTPFGNNKLGETTDTIRGREAHANYSSALGSKYVYNRSLPSGLRPDAIDWENRIVRELKPDNPLAIQRGWSQVRKYLSELFEITGDIWTAFVDTYKK
jgi:Restriction endonuclease fold toxin 9